MKLSFSKAAAAISAAPFLALARAQNALAVDFGEIPDTGGGADIHTAITDVIFGILTFLGIIAVLIIVIAGIRLIIGGADEGQREKARNSILYAIIGLIVILLAGAIVQWVEDTFVA